MRNLIFIALVIAAIVMVSLYIVRNYSVPSSVKNALQTDQGAPVTRMTQIPDRARQKVEAANRMADSSMNDAMKSVDREPR
ncbi:MAG TPA: hypothetical protein VLX68_07130 [Chitinivibrionales bacterium]|nr:hypothetical protein [Chitinivibrionales bacterium]